MEYKILVVIKLDLKCTSPYIETDMDHLKVVYKYFLGVGVIQVEPNVSGR